MKSYNTNKLRCDFALTDIFLNKKKSRIFKIPKLLKKVGKSMIL